MLRKLVIVSAFVGTAASVPIVYQQNPKALQNLVRAVVEYDSSAPTAEETASVRRDTAPRPAAQVDLTGRKVRLAADDRGHFAGDFKLNGREIPAMIDTGATLVAINETIAKRACIVLAASDFKYEVDTANGKVRAAAARIDSLQVGRIYVTDVQAVVLEDKALSKALIGMSFLSRLDTYRVENGTLVLEQ